MSEFGDIEVAKSSMPLECIIDRGKETKEPNWKMIGDKLIKSTFSLMP